MAGLDPAIQRFQWMAGSRCGRTKSGLAGRPWWGL